MTIVTDSCILSDNARRRTYLSGESNAVDGMFGSCQFTDFAEMQHNMMQLIAISAQRTAADVDRRQIDRTVQGQYRQLTDVFEHGLSLQRIPHNVQMSLPASTTPHCTGNSTAKYACARYVPVGDRCGWRRDRDQTAAAEDRR